MGIRAKSSDQVDLGWSENAADPTLRQYHVFGTDVNLF